MVKPTSFGEMVVERFPHLEKKIKNEILSLFRFAAEKQFRMLMSGETNILLPESIIILSKETGMGAEFLLDLHYEVQKFYLEECKKADLERIEFMLNTGEKE